MGAKADGISHGACLSKLGSAPPCRSARPRGKRRVADRCCFRRNANGTAWPGTGVYPEHGFLTMTAIDEVMAREIYELAYRLRLLASLETGGLPYRLACCADRCR